MSDEPPVPPRPGVARLTLGVPARLDPDATAGAIGTGMWFSDGVRTVCGAGGRAVFEVASAEAGATIRRLVGEGAPGVFFAAGFDPATSTTLLVPDDLTVDESAPSFDRAPLLYDATALEVTINESARSWAGSVAAAAAKIADPTNELRKIVLARVLRVRADTDLDPGVVLFQLARTFPRSYLFSIGSLVGASPELLGQALEGRFHARALAGTIGRDPDPQRDSELARALLESAKDRYEHGLLQAFLAARLSEVVDELNYAVEPQLLSLPNVHHLMTTFDGRLSGDAGLVGGLVDLVAGIHPTPAIAGVPQADALEWIRANEPPRGRLGGYAGWTDRLGNGQAVLAIRSLELVGREARLVVGNGIVAASDPDDEVRENQAKARGIIDAVTTL